MYCQGPKALFSLFPAPTGRKTRRIWFVKFSLIAQQTHLLTLKNFIKVLNKILCFMKKIHHIVKDLSASRLDFLSSVPCVSLKMESSIAHSQNHTRGVPAFFNTFLPFPPAKMRFTPYFTTPKHFLFFRNLTQKHAK